MKMKFGKWSVIWIFEQEIGVCLVQNKTMVVFLFKWGNYFLGEGEGEVAVFSAKRWDRRSSAGI